MSLWEEDPLILMARSFSSFFLLQNKMAARTVTREPVRIPMIKIKVLFPESVLLEAGSVAALVSCDFGSSGTGFGVGSGVGFEGF